MIYYTYSGYGIDLGKLAGVLDSPEREILCSGLDAADGVDLRFDVETPDVEIATPGNTNDFELLFLIPCAYVVGDAAKDIKTYSTDEANACLMEVISDYIRGTAELCGWSADDENDVLDAIESKFGEFVGFDGQRGPWTDCI